MRTVTATRYVSPLREGGSLPAIVEGSDDGLYVLKFRGAGQGPKALIAELVAGEIARVCGLPVPEIVFMQLDPDLARTEPDPEIQELIRASGGLNLALDYLPGSVTFDPLAERPAAPLASAVVWFDALVSNVDRTVRNTNLLMWHGRLWLIDHGAALYFHHAWDGVLERSTAPFPLIRDHVLLGFATALPEADAQLAPRLTEPALRAIVDLIPDEWLAPAAPLYVDPRSPQTAPAPRGGSNCVWGGPAHSCFADANEHRGAYLNYLLRRLLPPRRFVEEALRAHTDP